jgi:hypothetical protein
MRIFIIFLFILSGFFAGLSAQTLTLKGTVLDAATREPIVNANVYLDATTIGTVTDTLGMFSISLSKPVYTALIVRYIGYKKLILDPYENLPEILLMEEKDYSLKEVVVAGESKRGTFTEKQKMKAFKEQILGKTKVGYSCKILNEKDIRLI